MALGAAGVRRAIYDWFAPPAVQGINTLYQAMPWWAAGSKWELSVEDGWGCVAYIHLTNETEQRIAFGGASPNGGMKMVTYTVGLVLLFQYLIPTQIPAGWDESMYVNALDTLIDGVKARIRADHTFGTGPNGVVWQGGEGDGLNQPDIRVLRDLPRRGGNRTIHCWQVVEFDVCEIVFN